MFGAVHVTRSRTGADVVSRSEGRAVQTPYRVALSCYCPTCQCEVLADITPMRSVLPCGREGSVLCRSADVGVTTTQVGFMALVHRPCGTRLVVGRGSPIIVR